MPWPSPCPIPAAPAQPPAATGPPASGPWLALPAWPPLAGPAPPRRGVRPGPGRMWHNRRPDSPRASRASAVWDSQWALNCGNGQHAHLFPTCSVCIIGAHQIQGIGRPNVGGCGWIKTRLGAVVVSSYSGAACCSSCAPLAVTCQVGQRPCARPMDTMPRRDTVPPSENICGAWDRCSRGRRHTSSAASGRLVRFWADVLGRYKGETGFKAKQGP